jgi:hypothetical protein
MPGPNVLVALRSRAMREEGRPRSRFADQPNRPVIIGACPRSGTTLLRAMLDSHPEIGIPRETRFVLEAWERRWRFGNLREEAGRRRLARWIFNRKGSQAGRLGLDHREAVERLAAAPPTLGSLLALCFAMRAQKFGKDRWGDKRPMYAARMPAIWDLFPHAQFVNVVRDPRACVASMRTLGWYQGQVAPAVEMWERSIQTVNEWRPRLASDQLLEVKYEDLVGGSEAELQRVAAFAGLRGDDEALGEALRYHERREVRSQRYHPNVSRPPDPSRVSAWGAILERDEIAFIEEATAPLMRQHGYEPTLDGLSAPEELLRQLRWARRRRALAGRKLALADRLQKLVTDRGPLAAEQPTTTPVPSAPGR